MDRITLSLKSKNSLFAVIDWHVRVRPDCGQSQPDEAARAIPPIHSKSRIIRCPGK
jgi:hypothetical protein